jgi:hypothetical protein
MAILYEFSANQPFFSQKGELTINWAYADF